MAVPVLVQITGTVATLLSEVGPKSTVSGEQLICGPPPQPVSWMIGSMPLGSVVCSVASHV